MQVKDGMSSIVLTVGPGHSLRDAARLMAERNVGAAIVMDPDVSAAVSATTIVPVIGPW